MAHGLGHGLVLSLRSEVRDKSWQRGTVGKRSYSPHVSQEADRKGPGQDVGFKDTLPVTY